MIFGALVQNDNISRCFLNFFKIVIFQFVSGVKQQKMAQNDKKLSFMLRVSGTIYQMIVIYDTLV